MLDSVIKVEQFRGDGANPRQSQAFKDRLNPTWGDHEDIVVVENDNLTVRRRGAEVAFSREIIGAFVIDDAYLWVGRKRSQVRD